MSGDAGDHDGSDASTSPARDAGSDRPERDPSRSDGGSKPDDRGHAGTGGSAGGGEQDAGTAGGSGGTGSSSSDTCTPAPGAQPTWTEIDPGLEDYVQPEISAAGAAPPSGFAGIAYGNGVFVAPAASYDEDHIRWATSPDGITWTAHSEPIATGKTYSASRIHFLNGKFVFFQEHSGDGFLVYTSTDAKTWESKKITDNRAVVAEFDASPERLVLLGSSGTAFGSADMKTWDPVEVVAGGGLFSFNDVAYGNGRWVATINNGGQTYGSADGVSWSLIDGVSTPGGFRVEFGNGAWIAVAPGMYFTSSDGVKFTATTPTGEHNGSGLLRFAGGQFLDATYDFSQNIVFSVSHDGSAWEPFGMIAPPVSPASDTSVIRVIHDAAYGNCRYVLVGTLATQRRPQGAEWKQSAVPTVLVAELPHD